MRVAHFNATARGGAAEGALRLHAALRGEGVDSTFVTLDETGLPGGRVHYPGFGPGQKLERWWRRRRERRDWRDVGPIAGNFDSFTLDRTSLVPDASASFGGCDVAHFHSATGMVDFGRTLGAAARTGQRLAWTLHDMNVFTGGCHYDVGCGRFAEGCGKCPALRSSLPDDPSARIWRRKERALARLGAGQLHVIAPSLWLAGLARRSPLLGRFPVSVVPYGIDAELFRPVDRRAARAALGLPDDARIVLFVSGSMGNPRKGFPLLRQALEGIAREVPGLLLATVGASAPPDGEGLVSLGAFSDPRLLRLAYGAADLTAHPSLQENLSLTIMESLACGTPVVGFAAGGTPELARPGVSGETVPVGDVPALGAAIAGLLRDEERRRALGADARRMVESEYAPAAVARRHVEIYRQLLSAPSA